MFVLRPVLDGFIGVRLLMDIFFSFILVSGAYAVSEKKTTFVIGLLLIIPALTVTWLNHLPEFPVTVLLLGQIFEALFFAYISIVIIYNLFKQREITADVILGATCVYFLIGLMWTFVFSILEIIEPNSFQIPQDQEVSVFHFVYYSFVTLTTLGYGDITPISLPAKSFALLEAIMGQLYLAIMLAVLVGIYVSQSITKKSE
jgi:hypothetical protein